MMDMFFLSSGGAIDLCYNRDPDHILKRKKDGL